jgi:hypothetical protein
MSEKTPHRKVKQFPNPDIFKIYEDGKHRRYALLFSVNGAIFAIAQLFAQRPGSLTRLELSLGMIIFTIAMVIDIGKFGFKMKQYVDDDDDIFGPWGQAVLLLIGLLIGLGWLAIAL